jgi:hypothetical protein
MKTEPTIPDAGDYRLVPDRQVAERYGVHPKTISRWDANPDLGFPPPVVINNRFYRRLSALMVWERERAARSA